MKIVVGLGSIDEYIKFAEAGADEFFCGYVPYSWSQKYGTVLPLNRREVLCYNVQLGAFSELEILSGMMKKYEKPEIKIASFDSENVVSTSAGVNLTKFNTTNKYTSIEF